MKRSFEDLSELPTTRFISTTLSPTLMGGKHNDSQREAFKETPLYKSTFSLSTSTPYVPQRTPGPPDTHTMMLQNDAVGRLQITFWTGLRSTWD